MSNIDKRALREAAEKALPAMKHLLMMPNDELFDEVLPNVDGDVDAANAFNLLTGPETVLALLDELEAADALNKHLELAIRKAEGCSEALRRKTEAAEKRIAELEAREVVLPSTQDVHPLGPQSAKIFCEFHRSIVNRCADEIRKVGVKVSIKGN
ncbi:ead/Ea22-like family protein [Enterobacter roggenkampii]|uniref:ead/Ea22-like family protein n=1 Tax=Enterobacter roggenkampii TaxID=1812935 RepID=UPI002019AA70|nr:ead/Ea22-like family protein [Enterobacter roggenkampii]UQQ53042.1 ead/Ea22-like family protein [Enterobacter roggenkampii]